ncbi:GerMN domain-containing protein [Paenibacillus albicereus]|uniref:GerMN domain-containing protein n=1 Tax=Paenibacillus albicereus TaxID=2726185 RepID=A0A6H2GXT2_9BACL|nr:GerMN domain-containing protein [Paenibacillus albicereus]QJC51938.1 GerMN domain-containing protein [Paenibacillus albicereus]
MMQPKRRLAALLAAAAVAAALAGCGAKAPESGGAGASSPSPSPSPSPAASASPSLPPSSQTAEGSGEGASAGAGTEAGMKKATIKIYQTDAELLGLKEFKAEIEYEDAAGKLAAALKALAGADRDGHQSLWQGVEFRSVQLKDGAAQVDLTLPDEARLGGPGEQLAIDSLARTTFQFPEIQSLDVTVDGEAVESLMGHVELQHPILRDSYESTP